MAEVKESLHVLLKLLAHSLMAALFVITIAVVGTATAYALAKFCGGSNHLLCRVIWLALEAPLLFGIVVVVVSQVLNQADEFFSTLRKTIRSIARALRGIRKELTGRGRARAARRRVKRVRSEKELKAAAGDAVLQLKKTDEAA